jgi:hypothetical protein
MASVADQIKDVRGVKVLAHRVDNLERGQMRTLVDQLRDKLGSGVVVLGSATPDLVSFHHTLQGRYHLLRRPIAIFEAFLSMMRPCQVSLHVDLPIQTVCRQACIANIPLAFLGIQRSSMRLPDFPRESVELNLQIVAQSVREALHRTPCIHLT